jgi:hypothetical protein
MYSRFMSKYSAFNFEESGLGVSDAEAGESGESKSAANGAGQKQNEANLLIKDNSHEPSTCVAGWSGVWEKGTASESTSPFCPSRTTCSSAIR